MTPTPEQEAVVAAARDTDSNLLITAYAGAAKTTTLVMVAEALRNTATLSLAFNKKIAVEMAERLPSMCVSRTLNAIGHRAWADKIGKRRLRVDTSKTYNLVREWFDSPPPHSTRLVRKHQRESFPRIMEAVTAAKHAGWIPSRFAIPPATSLWKDEEFESILPETLEDWEWEAVTDVVMKSLALGFDGVIDFNDQILLPATFGAPFPRYPLVMVDEAQDLSLLNHEMLARLARDRLIAVGDSCQAIYAFRGAHENSMDLLRERFRMRHLRLTTSFRCPRAVTREARWRAPDMKWPEWAKEGEVRTADEWRAADLTRPGTAVICRNNAPLFRLALMLMADGVHPKLLGRDVEKPVLKALRELGAESAPQASLRSAIVRWEEARLARVRPYRKPAIRDLADCLRVFVRKGATLGEAIAFAEHVFSSNGAVHLMTGHKAKGLEYDHVWFLEPDLLDDEGQDRNLRYVIQTRAMCTLTYCTFDTYQSKKAA